MPPPWRSRPASLCCRRSPTHAEAGASVAGGGRGAARRQRRSGDAAAAPLDTIAALAACVYAGGLLGALAGGRVIARLGCRQSFVALVTAFALANGAS